MLRACLCICNSAMTKYYLMIFDKFDNLMFFVTVLLKTEKGTNLRTLSSVTCQSFSCAVRCALYTGCNAEGIFELAGMPVQQGGAKGFEEQGEGQRESGAFFEGGIRSRQGVQLGYSVDLTGYGNLPPPVMDREFRHRAVSNSRIC